ncbi:MAG: ribosomal-protein-serine acetyltransferase, partial [Hymenobacter sp.]|nr:ribosomal-protein-serine acetyltransferase [Hymenobacter sp.]
MQSYRPLAAHAPSYHHGAYRLIPIRYDDREPIRAWRNAQLEVLRQATPLTAAQQDAYFER